jgi:hypothetical protein
MIFTLEIVEPFCVLGPEPTELVPPPVIRSSDTQLAAHCRNVLALSHKPIGRHQLANNLLETMAMPRCHDLVEPSCPQHGPQDSHEPLDQGLSDKRWI